MAILKAKDIKRMDKKTRNEKLKDLRLELIKANVSANKTNAKTKEIKRAIARLLTYDRVSMFNKSENPRKVEIK
ncbi:MAG: 50S ribosomal protein L29 [Nanoarchaeota archaeon]|nr:50S ribosomal protein L29 [Nanoarchaeota archaeon]